MAPVTRTPFRQSLLSLQQPAALVPVAAREDMANMSHVKASRDSVLSAWLNRVDFQDVHSVFIAAPQEVSWQAVKQVDLRLSWMNRLCFSQRMSHSLLESGPQHWDGGYSLRQLPKFGFIPLEDIEGERVLYGMAGQFWEARGGIVKFESPEEFRHLRDPRFVRFVWGFHLQEEESPKLQAKGRAQAKQSALAKGCRLTTETWVECLSDEAQWCFAGHWGMMRPFNVLVRRQMLRTIKESAEAAFAARPLALPPQQP